MEEGQDSRGEGGWLEQQVQGPPLPFLEGREALSYHE